MVGCEGVEGCWGWNDYGDLRWTGRVERDSSEKSFLSKESNKHARQGDTGR